MAKPTRRWNGLFWVESTEGSRTDLSKHWRHIRIENEDGSVMHEFTSKEYLETLDEKYKKVLDNIVKKGE